MLKGGKRGPALVPGKADESLLFRWPRTGSSRSCRRRTRRTPSPSRPRNSACSSSGSTPARRTTRPRTPSPPAADRARRAAPGRPADQRRRHDGRRHARRLRPGERRAGLRRRLGPGDRLARRPQGPDPVGPVQPRRPPTRRGRATRSSPSGTSRPGGLKATFTGHGDQVKAVAVAARPQGVRCLGGLDRTIRFWDGAEGKPLRQFDAPAPGPRPGRLARRLALAASAGPTTSSASSNLADGKLKSCSPSRGTPGRSTTWRFLADGRPSSSRPRPTARRGSGRVPREARREAGRPDRPGRRKARRAALALAATPDGKASSPAGDDGEVLLWDRRRRAKRPDDRRPTARPVLALAVDPGRRPRA